MVAASRTRITICFTQDSLTDMSYSPVHIEVAGVRDTYVHGVGHVISTSVEGCRSRALSW